MKKLILLSLIYLLANNARAQKIFSEGTLTYEIKVETGNGEPQMADMFNGAKAYLFLKGGMSRFDLVSALGTSSTIWDAKKKEGAVLREYGSQKLLIRMNGNNWEEKNKKYKGISFQQMDETKIILGHSSKKAVAKLSDGSSFTVFYATDLVPENKEYDYSFKGLSGLPVEYESQVGKLKVRYVLVNINFEPVSTSKFEIPKTGYREMNFEESMNAKQ